MNILLWTAAGFLMILGLASLWEWLLLRWSRPKVPLLRYELIPLSGKVENAEQLLLYISIDAGERQIIFLDNGLEQSSRQHFLSMMEAYPYMKLLDAVDFWKLIFRENNLEEEAFM